MYSFLLGPNGFIYEFQMMENILFHNTNGLRNLPHRHRTTFKVIYNFLSDGLCSSIHYLIFKLIYPFPVGLHVHHNPSPFRGLL